MKKNDLIKMAREILGKKNYKEENQVGAKIDEKEFTYEDLPDNDRDSQEEGDHSSSLVPIENLSYKH